MPMLERKDDMVSGDKSWARGRTARMMLALPLALALGAPIPGRAGVGALTGVGHVTLVSACPGGFKIPIEGESHADGTWSFTIAGMHVGCVITWGNPITFAGPWDPVAPGCDPETGAGCPHSLDPTRPGFFALGPVPSRATMAMPSLRFCVRDRCFEGWALVERV